MADQRSHRRAKGPEQQHPFERDIDDARAFAKHTAERSKDQRGRNAKRRGDKLPGHASSRLFIQLQSPSAETDRIINACRMSDNSRVTCSVSRSKSAAPLCSAPKSNAAATTPTGWFRPSSATAIPINPYSGENPTLNFPAFPNTSPT